MNKSEVLYFITDLFKGKIKNVNLTTGYVRKKSAEAFKTLDSKDIDYVLDICEKLLELRKWESKVIAFDWVFRIRD